MQTMKDSNAYWISPIGELVAVGKTHIDEVIDYPKFFGYTDEKIKALYKKYKEPMRLEGKARNDIVHDLIRKNWIRIRYDHGDDCYHIEIWQLTKPQKDHLQAWACGLSEINDKRKYSQAGIIENSTGEIKLISVQDLANEMLYNNEEKGEMREQLIFLNSAAGIGC
jgi:hypothetical protein